MAVRVVFKSDGKANIRGSSIGSNQIKVRMEKMIKGLQPSLEAYCNEKAQDIQRYMVESHKWKNRTGTAEASLYARVTTTQRKYSSTIECGYGSNIFYSVYLENYYGGKYALIEPTIKKWGPLVLEGTADLMDRMGYGDKFYRG